MTGPSAGLGLLVSNSEAELSETSAAVADVSSGPIYEDISDAEPDILIAVSSDSDLDTVEPDDPVELQSAAIGPADPLVPLAPTEAVHQVPASADYCGKPLAELKRQLQTIDDEELLSASIKTTAPARRVAQELAQNHLLGKRQRRRLPRRVEDIQRGYQSAMQAIEDITPAAMATEAEWVAFAHAVRDMAARHLTD